MLIDNNLIDLVQSGLQSQLKARISVDLIGDTLVVSFTAIQDIVYTYSFHLDAFVLELPPGTLAGHIVKKALKRYKRYIKNLFFKSQKRLDVLDTSLYNR